VFSEISFKGEKIMKVRLVYLSILLMAGAIGCVPALIGGGAIGTYKVATDRRTPEVLLSDSAVSARVKTALIEDGLVKGRQIDVDTQEGQVILSGVVESGLQENRALEIARGVKGVLSVKNNLQVGSRTVRQIIDDKMIGNRIKSDLINEDGVRSLNIDVDVYKGVVTLTGEVNDPDIKTRIIAIAQEVEGTVSVVDNLTVK
jgi:hyperosmotically inducible periplasmic protein